MKHRVPTAKVSVSMLALALIVGVFLVSTATAAEIEIIPDVVYGHKDGLVRADAREEID